MIKLSITSLFVVVNFFYLIRCEDELDWWQTSVIYQIYPRSFKDSNKDGVGDLKGIEEKVDYFVDTGIQAVWLSPIYKSPMVDFGYDISDFKQIDPLFGSLEDLISLKNALHAKGVRLILDFVPNHSSDEHEWFKKSKQRIDPYTDYYVWVDPKENGPPNNWLSQFEGSAWEYVEERQQYYYHAFAVKQPDLNYRSEHLKREMKDIIKFWLDVGVDGFRFDAVPFLLEDVYLHDEVKISGQLVTLRSADTLYHNYTCDLPETYDLLAEFRVLLDEYKFKDGRTRFMLTEAYSSRENTMKYYGDDSREMSHLPFNFDFITRFNGSSDAKDIDNIVHDWLSNMPEGRWPNWVIGNHDNKRAASRFGCDVIDALHIITLLLPGTPITYYGDELGMTDAFIRWDQTVDIQALNGDPNLYMQLSRDTARTPFQWDLSRNAGFSKGNKTWLPVNSDYWKLNLETEKKEIKSHYKVYKKLLKMRSKDVFRKGELQTYVISDSVFAFTRILNGSDVHVIVVNIGSDYETIVLNNTIPHLNEKLKVQVASINSEHIIGDSLRTTNHGFMMRPKSALVLDGAASVNFVTIPVLFICVLLGLTV